jgi:hypothetical protein
VKITGLPILQRYSEDHRTKITGLPCDLFALDEPHAIIGISERNRDEGTSDERDIFYS